MRGLRRQAELRPARTPRVPAVAPPSPLWRSAVALLLTALGGPVWNVVLLPLPAADLTVGRGLVVLTALLLARDVHYAPRPLAPVPRAVWLLLATLTALWTWIVASVLLWGCRCAGEVAGFSELLALVVLTAFAAVFEPRLRPVLVLAIIAGAVLTALLTIAGVDGLSAGARASEPEFTRLTGPYGNPNFLAFAIGFAIPAALAATRIWAGRRGAVLWLAAALLSVIVVLTYSRGALLSVALATVLVLVLLYPRGTRARRLAVGAIVAAGAAAAVVYPIFVEHRRDTSSLHVVAHLRALDRSGWDANSEGLIPAGPGKMRNPAPGVLEVRTDGPGQGVSRELPAGDVDDAYELRFEARAVAGAQALRFGLEDNLRANGPIARGATLGSGWRALRVTWRPAAASPNPRLYIWSPVAGDGFQVRRVSTVVRRPGAPVVRTAFATALTGNSLGQLKAAQAKIDARDIDSRAIGVDLALRAFASQPARGIGWGGFLAYSTAHSQFTDLPTHNEYLRFLAELGLVGTGLLALAGLAIASAFWRRRLDPLGLALLGMLVAGAAGLAFVNGLATPAATAPLAFAAALVCARSGAGSQAPGGEAWVGPLWPTPSDRAAATAGDRARAVAGGVLAAGRHAPAAVAGALRAVRRAAPPIAPAGWAAWLQRTEHRLRGAGRAAGGALRARGARTAAGHPLAARGAVAGGARVTRRRVARGVLVLALLATAVLVLPGMHASSTQTELAPLELGQAASPPSAAIAGPVSEDVDGYRVATGLGFVTVPLDLPRRRRGRTLLRIWAYGPAGVRTTAILRGADGSQRTLGRAVNWVGKIFDVTEQARRGPVSLRVSSRNATAGSVLFFDRVAPLAVSGTPDLGAPGWAVGLLVALLTIALLELTGRLDRHWPLALALAPTAAVLWDEIAGTTFVALPPGSAATWTAATSASWLGLHDGVLAGSWVGLSSLAVQVFHAWAPLVGTDPVAARAAAILTALLALAAVYAFAHRAAGRVAAVIAVLLAMASSGFRDAIVAGDALPVLVLAGALFGYALHACLNDATPVALAVLGAGAALLALAEPTWLPGALIAIVVVALLCPPPPLRRQAVVAGLLATLVCLVPHLASTASQNDGRMLADLGDRTAAVRPPTRIADGVLTGGRRSMDAYHPAAEAALSGAGALADTIARVALVAGAVFALALARLRLLVLLSALVVAPTLFLSGRTAFDPAHAGAALWPAMLVAATILAFTAARVVRS